MKLTGHNLIGSSARRGHGNVIRAVDASSGEYLPPEFGGATLDDLHEACDLASKAFDTYRQTSLEDRARFLEAIAQNILEIGDDLIVRCMAESGLPRARVEGERGRTIFQLRMFSGVVRAGDFLGARIEHSRPERTPLPRPDIRLCNIPIGPVAVFGASNFPLAFSVAGGDTASALAAGCPVIVKAHPAHPGTSELVGHAVQKAVFDCDIPGGVFSLLFADGYEIGQALVSDARIKAVGFTGSRSGGRAFTKIAAARSEPIPVFAEMSSINPVLLFPRALQTRGQSIANDYINSLTMGSGQFCTNPGIVLAIDGTALTSFLIFAKEALEKVPAGKMLTTDIRSRYCEDVKRLESHSKMTLIGKGIQGGERDAQASLFSVNAKEFLTDKQLQNEVFGACSLVVRCSDETMFKQVFDDLEGQLTVSLHIDSGDADMAKSMLPALEKKAGRLIVNAFGTGVEVSDAMVHGGPYPATSDGRSTSVGSLAIQRFLRPVCYQNFPSELLPTSLLDPNPLNLRRRTDGEWK